MKILSKLTLVAERDDADLKFSRGNQELDISIEVKGKNRIEYKADLDKH